MGARTTALGRCVGDVSEFERAWGRWPLRMRGSDPAAFADVFGMAALDELLESSIRTPTIRMVRDGTPLAPTEFCGRVRLGGRHLDDVVVPTKVISALRDGASLVLQSLHRVHPGVARFVGELQAEIGHPVQANAYLTPPGATGLAPHADAHDVLVIQLAGAKEWAVEGLGDITMRAGDSMYVPADTTHSAHTGDDYSLHLTLGLIRVTQRDLIVRLLADVEALDTPLPIGFRAGAPEALRGAVVAALSVVERLLVDVEPDDVVASEQSRRLAPPTQPGRVSSLVRTASLRADTPIRWVGGPPRARRATTSEPRAAWSPIDSVCWNQHDRVDIHVGARILTIPAKVVPAIAQLARVEVQRVDELVGLDTASCLVVARRLIQESACVIDDNEV